MSLTGAKRFGLTATVFFLLVNAPAATPPTVRLPSRDLQERYERIRAVNQQTHNDALALAVAGYDPTKKGALFPREGITRKRRLQAVRLSPDGSHIAYLLREKKGASLWHLNPRDGTRMRLLHGKIVTLHGWTNDGRLVFETPDAVAVLDEHRREPRYIAGLDPEKKETFLGFDRNNGVLIGRTDQADWFHLVRIDEQGKERNLYSGAAPLQDFCLNDDGTLAIYKIAVADQQILYRLRAGQSEELARFDLFDDADLVAWHETTQKLILRAAFEQDLIQLFEWHLASGERRARHRDPRNLMDMEQVVLDPETRMPLLVKYKGHHHFNSYGLQPAVQRRMLEIEALLPGKNLTIDPGGDLWLIRAAASHLSQPSYYLHRKGHETLQPILVDETDPTTAPADTRHAKVPFRYRAGDGFLLHGFITLPNGGRLAECPLIVVPHGGPFTRTKPGFSAHTQFLASRGYIVLEPNFRASRGYGLAYTKAANRDFGDGVVQQDIIDAVLFTLSKGFGDPGRLAIHGASFGGFSVFCGLTFTPELFQVGVAVVPPPDLGKAVLFWPEDKNLGNGIRRDHALKGTLVDPNNPQDIMRLRAQSPEPEADRIQRPLLIIAGNLDQQVNILDVRHYALVLDQLAKPVSLFTAKQEGHQFERDEALHAQYYLLEKMLADHLGGGLQPLTSPSLKRFIKKNLDIDRNQLLTPPPSRNR